MESGIVPFLHLPQTIGVHPDAVGQGIPGQPGRLFEPLQPVGKVLGKFVVHRLVYSPLPSQGLLLVAQYVHNVGKQRLHAAGHPLVVHPQGRLQLLPGQAGHLPEPLQTLREILRQEPVYRFKLTHVVSIRAGSVYVIHTMLLIFGLLTLHSVSTEIS